MASSNPRQRGFAGPLLAAAALFPAIASAQAVVRPLELHGTAGLGQVYLDESYPDHGEFGGGVRFFLTRRFAVEGAVWPNGGLGARIFVGDRYFLAPEVRGPIFLTHSTTTMIRDTP